MYREGGKKWEAYRNTVYSRLTLAAKQDGQRNVYWAGDDYLGNILQLSSLCYEIGESEKDDDFKIFVAVILHAVTVADFENI
jgi:hypothetical protein